MSGPASGGPSSAMRAAVSGSACTALHPVTDRRVSRSRSNGGRGAVRSAVARKPSVSARPRLNWRARRGIWLRRAARLTTVLPSKIAQMRWSRSSLAKPSPGGEVRKPRTPSSSPSEPSVSWVSVGTYALVIAEIALSSPGRVCTERAESALTASAVSAAAAARPRMRRTCGTSARRRPYSSRPVTKSRASRRAWSAAPRESAVQATRVSWSVLRTTAIPSPSSPTRASAGTGAPSRAKPLMSAPRMPCVRTFGRLRQAPSGSRRLSTRKRLKPRPPPAGSVRARTQARVERVALLMSHFSPVSRQPGPTASAPASVSATAANSLASRSAPWSRSVSPQQTASPPRTRSASRAAWSGVPATHTGAAPRNVLPCAMATVRSVSYTHL